MKAWHYNISRILKKKCVKEAIVSCLSELEGTKDHSLVIQMLNNYFNVRNKGFGSNWLYLPRSKVILHITKKGIYFKPSVKTVDFVKNSLNSLNSGLYEAIGKKDWVITFEKTHPPKIGN